MFVRNTRVRVLEYACQVWSPREVTHSNRIEAVQRRFSRFALNLPPWRSSYDSNDALTYLDRLKMTNLELLSKRRRVADLVFLHGLINMTIVSTKLYDKVQFANRRRNLRHTSTFCIPFCRTDYLKHESIIRMCSLANITPSFSVSCSKDQLKKNLYSLDHF